jgi:hypothetical protein
MSRALEECLTALRDRRNLQEVLHRYPADREELIGMLRLSVELSSLGAPTPDPGFRLRTRNRMLAVAAQRRRSDPRSWLDWLPRPAARLALAGACAVAIVAGGISVGAASNGSLPGDPLYGVKLGVEQAQLATSFDASARARLQLHFADIRLEEAQRLYSQGRDREAVALVKQYEAAMARFSHSVASTTLDDRSVTELSLLLETRQARADASLNALAGSLNAHGDARSAAVVAQAQSHVDQSLKGSKVDLQAQAAAHQDSTTSSSAHQLKPAGGQR